jgi:anti-sigma factor RsiW
MQTEQFRTMLDAYGSRPDRWPPEQRADMESFAREHDEAQRWLAEARALDEALDAVAVESVDLTARVLAALPRSRFDALLEWLLPQAPAQWWRPAMAAAAPLVLGVAIGLGDGGAAQDWSAEEQALLVPATGSLFDDNPGGLFE